jgi:hypothetical protein
MHVIGFGHMGRAVGELDIADGAGLDRLQPLDRAAALAYSTGGMPSFLMLRPSSA